MGFAGLRTHSDKKTTICTSSDGHTESETQNRLAKRTSKDSIKTQEGEGVLDLHHAGSVRTQRKDNSSVRVGSPCIGARKNNADRDGQLSIADVVPQAAAHSSDDFSLPRHGDRRVNIRERISGIR